MSRTFRASVSLALAVLLCSPAVTLVEAGDRNKARTSVNNKSKNVNRNTNVNRDVTRNTNLNSNRNVNRNVNIDRDVDIDRDIDIDVDVDRHGCCYHSHGWGVAAAVATTAVVTAAVVGTRVTVLPPACTVVYVNGFTYQQCGTVWYQPQFVGTSTTYIVVNPPR